MDHIIWAKNEDFRCPVPKWRPFCKRLTIDYLPRRVIKPNQTCYILRNSLQLINPKNVITEQSLYVMLQFCQEFLLKWCWSIPWAYRMLHWNRSSGVMQRPSCNWLKWIFAKFPVNFRLLHFQDCVLIFIWKNFLSQVYYTIA